MNCVYHYKYCNGRILHYILPHRPKIFLPDQSHCLQEIAAFLSAFQQRCNQGSRYLPRLNMSSKMIRVAIMLCFLRALVKFHHMKSTSTSLIICLTFSPKSISGGLYQSVTTSCVKFLTGTPKARANPKSASLIFPL